MQYYLTTAKNVNFSLIHHRSTTKVQLKFHKVARYTIQNILCNKNKISGCLQQVQ